MRSNKTISWSTVLGTRRCYPTYRDGSPLQPTRLTIRATATPITHCDPEFGGADSDSTSPLSSFASNRIRIRWRVSGFLSRAFICLRGGQKGLLALAIPIQGTTEAHSLPLARLICCRRSILEVHSFRADRGPGAWGLGGLPP